LIAVGSWNFYKLKFYDYLSGDLGDPTSSGDFTQVKQYPLLYGGYPRYFGAFGGIKKVKGTNFLVV
jgi:hypothetical protein